MWPIVCAIASQQFGLITRAELIGLGLAERSIDDRIASGALIVVHPAVYRVAGAPESWEQACHAALLATERRAVLSFRAAAVEWSLEGVEATVPELLLLHTEPNLELSPAIVRRTRCLPNHDVTRRRGLLLTSPARTLMDLASVLRRNPLDRAIESALRDQIATLDQMQRCLDGRGPQGVKGWGLFNELVQKRVGTRPTGSWKENVFFNALERRGLPLPVGQYVVKDAEGKFIARVDYAYPKQKIAIEIQGRGHRDYSQQIRDDDRFGDLIVAGWKPLPFSQTDRDGQLKAFAKLERAFAAFGTPERVRNAVKRPKRRKGDPEGRPGR
jgi:hypothetical protein